MEYEQLSKSYEYGLSKIYEMVINNNPSYAYLLEGNSLTDQKLVMATCTATSTSSRTTSASAPRTSTQGPVTDPIEAPDGYDPDRRWIDKMANHGAASRAT
jgi:stage V sporulation protein R